MIGKLLFAARLVLLPLVFLALVLLPEPVSAHQVNLTNAHISIEGDEVAVTIGIKGSDVDRATGTAIYDPASGTVDGGVLHDAAAVILEYFTRNVSLGEAGGTACRLASARALPDRDGVAVTLDWDCAGVAGERTYRSTVLTDIEPTARQIVLIDNGRGSEEAAQILLNAEQPEVALSDKSPGLGDVVLRYVEAGI